MMRVTEIYGLMMKFEPMRVTLVSRAFNEGLNFGNIATKNEEGGTGDTDSGRKRKYWNCGSNHLKSRIPSWKTREKNKSEKDKSV